MLQVKSNVVIGVKFRDGNNKNRIKLIYELSYSDLMVASKII